MRSLKEVVQERSLDWSTIEDPVLKSILDDAKYSHWIESIHKHDALSEEEKTLNEQMSTEDQELARQDYEDERNGVLRQTQLLPPPPPVVTL